MYQTIYNRAITMSRDELQQLVKDILEFQWSTPISVSVKDGKVIKSRKEKVAKEDKPMGPLTWWQMSTQNIQPRLRALIPNDENAKNQEVYLDIMSLLKERNHLTKEKVLAGNFPSDEELLRAYNDRTKDEATIERFKALRVANAERKEQHKKDKENGLIKRGRKPGSGNSKTSKREEAAAANDKSVLDEIQSLMGDDDNRTCVDSEDGDTLSVTDTVHDDDGNTVFTNADNADDFEEESDDDSDEEEEEPLISEKRDILGKKVWYYGNSLGGFCWKYSKEGDHKGKYLGFYETNASEFNPKITPEDA